MNPLEKTLLLNLLEINDKGIVVEGENEQLEFKEFFERNKKEAKAKYAKELAAMYNSKGGYLVFGVRSKTNELVGLQDFKEPDSAEIADDLNDYFKPSFNHRQTSITINEKVIFVIYVHARQDIPTVCVKTYPDVINDGTIYYKYSSQASPIHSEDLIHLMMSLKSQDTKKLGDLKEKELTIMHKPKIERGLSGLIDGRLKLSLQNKGTRIQITSVNSKEPTINASFHVKTPYWFEPNMTLALQASCNDDSNINNKEYLIQLMVRNEFDQDYGITLQCKGGSVKILEPEEF